MWSDGMLENEWPVLPAAGHGAGFHVDGWPGVGGGKKHDAVTALHVEGSGTQLETSSALAARPSMYRARSPSLSVRIEALIGTR